MAFDSECVCAAALLSDGFHVLVTFGCCQSVETMELVFSTQQPISLF